MATGTPVWCAHLGEPPPNLRLGSVGWLTPQQALRFSKQRTLSCKLGSVSFRLQNSPVLKAYPSCSRQCRSRLNPPSMMTRLGRFLTTMHRVRSANVFEKIHRCCTHTRTCATAPNGTLVTILPSRATKTFSTRP